MNRASKETQVVPWSVISDQANTELTADEKLSVQEAVQAAINRYIDKHNLPRNPKTLQRVSAIVADATSTFINPQQPLPTKKRELLKLIEQALELRYQTLTQTAHTIRDLRGFSGRESNRYNHQDLVLNTDHIREIEHSLKSFHQIVNIAKFQEFNQSVADRQEATHIIAYTIISRTLTVTKPNLEPKEIDRHTNQILDDLDMVSRICRGYVFSVIANQLNRETIINPFLIQPRQIEEISQNLTSTLTALDYQTIVSQVIEYLGLENTDTYRDTILSYAQQLIVKMYSWMRSKQYDLSPEHPDYWRKLTEIFNGLPLDSILEKSGWVIDPDQLITAQLGSLPHIWGENPLIIEGYAMPSALGLTGAIRSYNKKFLSEDQKILQNLIEARGALYKYIAAKEKYPKIVNDLKAKYEGVSDQPMTVDDLIRSMGSSIKPPVTELQRQELQYVLTFNSTLHISTEISRLRKTLVRFSNAKKDDSRFRLALRSVDDEELELKALKQILRAKTHSIFIKIKSIEDKLGGVNQDLSKPNWANFPEFARGIRNPLFDSYHIERELRRVEHWISEMEANPDQPLPREFLQHKDRIHEFINWREANTNTAPKSPLAYRFKRVHTLFQAEIDSLPTKFYSFWFNEELRKRRKLLRKYQDLTNERKTFEDDLVLLDNARNSSSPEKIIEGLKKVSSKETIRQYSKWLEARVPPEEFIQPDSFHLYYQAYNQAREFVQLHASIPGGIHVHIPTADKAPKLVESYVRKTLKRMRRRKDQADQPIIDIQKEISFFRSLHVINARIIEFLEMMAKFATGKPNPFVPIHLLDGYQTLELISAASHRMLVVDAYNLLTSTEQQLEQSIAIKEALKYNIEWRKNYQFRRSEKVKIERLESDIENADQNLLMAMQRLGYAAPESLLFYPTD